MPDLRPPAYCRIDTLARELDVSETTVRDYVNRGLLPRPRKIGRCALWKWAEVEAMLDRGQDAAAATPPDPLLQAVQQR
jgi:predicted DNA-binding transcriptional regulator AlpA